MPPSDGDASRAAGHVLVAPGTTLGQLLKLTGAAATGGEAKALIAQGLVSVNHVVEKRRGRKLSEGDTVVVQGVEFEVSVRESEDRSGPAH